MTKGGVLYKKKKNKKKTKTPPKKKKKKKKKTAARGRSFSQEIALFLVVTKARYYKLHNKQVYDKDLFIKQLESENKA